MSDKDQSPEERVNRMNPSTWLLKKFLKSTSGDATLVTKQDLLDNFPMGEWQEWEPKLDVIGFEMLPNVPQLLCVIGRDKSTIRWRQDNDLRYVLVAGDCNSLVHGKLEVGKTYVTVSGVTEQWVTEHGCTIISYL